LIGEEIYDEFDPEGARHGEVTSYVPPQSIAPDSDVPPVLRRKGSAPQLSSPETSRAAVPSSQPTQRSASGSGTPVLRPIAIPALKGLSFLTGRSRSEPPVPRDGKLTSSARLTVPEAGDKWKPKPSAPANTHNGIDEKTLELVSAPPVEVPAPPAPAYLPPPVAVSTVPVLMPGGPINDAARVRQEASTISRSTSPGPSLSEALLRARRPATPHGYTTAPGKGTRFKSTPFGVADHVLRLGESQQRHQQSQTPTPDDLKRENGEGSTNRIMRSDMGCKGEGF
jgi:metal transporter CNNM